MATTSIQWTEYSWQVTAGCTRISPGCGRATGGGCYAEKMAGRLAAMAQKDLNDGRDPGSKRVYLDVVNQKAGTGLNGYGPKSGWSRKVVTLPDNLEQPLRWKKPRRIFVDSMSDLFHADVPFDYIDLVFAAMAQAYWHTYQVLTKRTERMAEYFNSRDSHLAMTRCFRNFVDYDRPVGPWPLPNVWLGTSVEDQQRADERIPHLLRCPAAVRWLSCEPLLGPVNITPAFVNVRNQRHLGTGEERKICSECNRVLAGADRFDDRFPSSICLTCCRPIGWVVVGGESGPNSAPCDIRWIRSVVEQCQTAKVPVFVKQVGAKPLVYVHDDNNTTQDTGRLVPGRITDTKGGNPDDWPADLRVREFPAPAAGAAEPGGGA